MITKTNVVFNQSFKNEWLLNNIVIEIILKINLISLVLYFQNVYSYMNEY